MNDVDIWSRFRMGDNDALSLIYSENSKKLYLFGSKLTPNHTIIEDSIQDLFSDLVRNRRKLGDTDNINFYLLKSFKRKLLRQLQKEKRYELNDKHENFVFDITYSIENEIINKDSTTTRLHQLHKALNELSPRQKEAIYLRFTEELEYAEIAEILEMSIEACRNLIYRAIKSLKESIQGNFSVILVYLQTILKKNI
ncbi:MAG: sigma-70 family RNA polymerase sigma factor [Prolixibacteraceae bacterium]|jgi:RNA polymerase sigma factor (sigma-70 family)|nr:sigma-70 family RNA polymerase sigma factor [Prolixibacteraceae bacterium]